jgi:pyrroloquinoline quinone biosynthesis protein E
VDFGGCRCQAFILTGDATNPDPVCTLTPHRAIIDAALAGTNGPGDYLYRTIPAEPQPA